MINSPNSAQGWPEPPSIETAYTWRGFGFPTPREPA